MTGKVGGLLGIPVVVREETESGETRTVAEATFLGFQVRECGDSAQEAILRLCEAVQGAAVEGELRCSVDYAGAESAGPWFKTPALAAEFIVENGGPQFSEADLAKLQHLRDSIERGDWSITLIFVPAESLHDEWEGW